MSVLEIRNLSRAYGSIQALDDLSFAVNSGEIFGFVGANGAGKTTAMRIMLGVLSADAGGVFWDGQELNLESRRRVGYMPEERGLYPKMRVGEHLEYLAQLHGMSKAEAVAATDKWVSKLGIAERRGDDIQKLSLGNQQRVQLAAALIHDPQVLVLDEPFSGLDPVAVDVMSSVLVERAQAGVPVIFSSHQLDLVERLCDRVGIIKSGQLVAEGSIEQLRGQADVRWLIEVPNAPAGWVTEVTGALVVEQQGAAVTVTWPSYSAGAEQVLLAAGLRHGPVTEFRRVLPTLTDLFRHVVSLEPGESNPQEVAA